MAITNIKLYTGFATYKNNIISQCLVLDNDYKLEKTASKINIKRKLTTEHSMKFKYVWLSAMKP